jgi:hypothetical protein
MKDELKQAKSAKAATSKAYKVAAQLWNRAAKAEFRADRTVLRLQDKIDALKNKLSGAD